MQASRRLRFPKLSGKEENSWRMFTRRIATDWLQVSAPLTLSRSCASFRRRVTVVTSALNACQLVQTPTVRSSRASDISNPWRLYLPLRSGEGDLSWKGLLQLHLMGSGDLLAHQQN